MNIFKKIEKFNSDMSSASFWAEADRYVPDMGHAFLSEGWGEV